MLEVTEIIIFNSESLDFQLLCVGDLIHFIAHFIAYFLSFCHLVCGLSPFIVWSPFDQITKLCKLHTGTDKRAGYHFDYCILWHSIK